jgi:hypothetical protein
MLLAGKRPHRGGALLGTAVVPQPVSGLSPALPAAHQLSIVVLNFADATVEVTQRGLPPSSVLLLAAGLERAPESLEFPASLHISARRWAVVVIMPVAMVVVVPVTGLVMPVAMVVVAPVTGLVVMPVALAVVASVTGLVVMPIALAVVAPVTAISPLAARQVSVVIFNFASALVEVPE